MIFKHSGRALRALLPVPERATNPASVLAVPAPRSFHAMGFRHLDTTLSTLLIGSSVHILPRHTPAMPMVASAASGVLGGFFAR